MLLSFTLSSFANQILKVTFAVYRPWIRSPLIEPIANAKITATDYSFPSGHVANASSVYGSLALSLKNDQRTLAKLLCVLVIGIMFSRNYLGVHTPQDVLVSLAVAVSLIFFSNGLLKWVENGNDRDTLLMLAGVILSIALATYSFFKPYPIDYVDGKILVDPKFVMIDTFSCTGRMIGFWVAWFIDRRFIHYQPQFKSTWQIIIVSVCGFFSLMLMLFFLSNELNKFWGDKLWSSFSSNIIIMVFIIVIYPWLINLFVSKTSSSSSNNFI